MSGLDPIAFLLYISISLFILFFIFYVLLFGDNTFHQHTPIAKLHHFLTHALPFFLHNKLLVPICGPENASRLPATFARVFEIYCMPAAYFLLLTAGLLTVNATVISRLSELDFIDSTMSPCPRSRLFCHTPTATPFPLSTPPQVIYMYALVALLSWFAVFFTDPATITSSSFLSLAPLYPYDKVLFYPNHPCPTCHLPKLPRSKHCPLCNRCVARFDHHCGWVGTCVGYFNVRYFLFFLAFHALMILHGWSLAVELVYSRVLDLIAGDYIYAPTNAPITKFSFQIAFIAETNLCCLAIVLGLTFWMVLGFLAYHISLVIRNKTTNESEKWSAVIERTISYAKENGRSIEKAIYDEAVEDAEKDGFPIEQAIAALPAFDDKGLPLNIYNRGVRYNFAEVFLPDAFQRNAVENMETEDREMWMKAMQIGKED